MAFFQPVADDHQRFDCRAGIDAEPTAHGNSTVPEGRLARLENGLLAEKVRPVESSWNRWFPLSSLPGSVSCWNLRFYLCSQHSVLFFDDSERSSSHNVNDCDFDNFVRMFHVVDHWLDRHRDCAP